MSQPTLSAAVAGTWSTLSETAHRVEASSAFGLAGRSASWSLTARPGLPARGGAPLTSNPETRAALRAVAFHLALACQLLGVPETVCV